MAAIAGSKGRLVLLDKLGNCSTGEKGRSYPGRVVLAKDLLLGKATCRDAIHFFNENARLREISVEVNMKCNLRCHYCYLAERPQTEPVPLGIWEERLKEGAQMGVHLFAIVGKEPFFDKRGPSLLCFLDRLAGAQNRPFRYGVVTNGTLVHRHLDTLAGLSRMSYADVSVDGLAAVNDPVRGEGSFSKAMHGYRALQKLQNVDSLFLTSVVHKNSIHRLAEFISAMSNMGVQNFHFAPVHNYTLNPNLDTLLLSAQEMASVLDILSECAGAFLIDAKGQVVLDLDPEHAWLFLGDERFKFEEIEEDVNEVLYIQPRKDRRFFIKVNLFAPYFWYSARISHDGWYLAELDSVAWASEETAIGNIEEKTLKELFSLARVKNGWFESYFRSFVRRQLEIARTGKLPQAVGVGLRQIYQEPALSDKALLSA